MNRIVNFIASIHCWSIHIWADWKTYSNARAWAWAMYDLDEWLRSQIKYSEKEELQPARDKLYDILEARGISMGDLF